MTHLAIVTPPLAGHINALSALGEALIDRGHRVTLLGPLDAQRWVARGRLGFQPIGREDYPEGSLESDAKRMGALRGLLGVRGMVADLARMTDMVCREAPSALREIGAEGLIVDQLEPGGAIAAEETGLPYVTVATALHVNRNENVPPPFVGWRYDPTSYGRWKVRGAYRVSDRLMAPIGDVLEHHCRRLGLRPRRDASDFVSPLADLTQAVRSIDYPRDDLPSTFHRVGPLRRADPRPLPPLDALPRGRPLAFCSLGTLQGSRLGLFRTIARACEAEGMNLVLVHCGRLSDAEAASLPGNIIVRDFVPQGRVLKRADLAIVHGGFNTVLDALAARTPLVVLPLAMEQPAIAARLERAGVARRVSPHLATVGRVRSAIDALRSDESLPDRLDMVAQDIESAGGAERAADIVERTLARSATGKERLHA